MSYDLIVFDLASAPRVRKQFLTWYEQQCEWQESHDYNDPEIPAPALRQWFRAMIDGFPPMNGPLASDDPGNPRVTDYSLGRSLIYAAFAWSEAKAAYDQAKELAAKHAVGFFDVSGDDGDIWWPVPGWTLSGEARGEIPLPLDLAFGEVLKKLDPKKNSFYILSEQKGSYMQCGGSKKACTVELRLYSSRDRYKHYVVGHTKASTERASVKMSGGEIILQKGEILDAQEAAELFDLFVAGKEFPKKYSLREKSV